MVIRMRVLFVFGVVLSLCVSCGGTTFVRGPYPGRISVQNETHLTLTIRFVTRALKTIETVVEPGQTEVVSGDEPIKGGKEVELTVVAPTSRGDLQSIKIRVVVDDDTVVRITAVRDNGRIEGENFEPSEGGATYL